jgi:hypothetical protein
MNKFVISERIFETEDSNSIFYYAGPICISVSCWKEEIKLETKEIWKDELIKCLETAKKAWEIEDNQIEIKENEIIIKINYNTLKLYIEHQIMYI